MTPTEVIAFLARQKHGVIATLAPDGRPEAAVVGFAWTPAGEAVFDTLGDTHKAQNLRRDGRAAVTVWDGAQTVQLQGACDEPQGAERERLVQRYLEVFPDGHERLKWKGLTHFRFRASWARWSDFSGAEPAITHFERGLGER
jgi:PPOX class probable F420-dependent enzyme